MKNFDYSIVQNPEIFEVNRLPAHSDHEYFRNEESINFKYSLNGLWKFNYAENYDVCDKKFFSPKQDCRDWDDIKVPGHIQMQGYDGIMYVNHQYPWDGHEELKPPEIPRLYNPVGLYVKYFTLPDFMNERPVFISFQGVESGFALWLNGSFIGYSEDSFTPSEFELTPYILDGENKLAVAVFKWTSGSWLEDQDFFRFSGIFRDVYLYTVPDVHIKDLKILTLLDDEYKDAVLSVDILSTADGKATLSLVGHGACIEDKLDLQKGINHLDINVDAPLLWSAEKPYLYELTIKVYGNDGAFCELVKENVGFRRFEIKDNIMCLNGKRIVFKGVNRHEFSSISGRVMAYGDILKDITAIKQNNINAIRTSHYPNHTEFYRLCDVYGIYVIDECNLETHGTWYPLFEGQAGKENVLPGDRPEYRQNVTDRAKSMYERDKNHPCILMWSLGNESYGGQNLKYMYDKLHEWDNSRTVHYEGVFHDRSAEPLSDIESTMYVPVKDIKQWLKTHRDKPYICCEYAHAMGNSLGAMDKYTELAYSDPLFQGGFIWDYIDQAISTRDAYGESFEGYGGDFDDRPNDFSFSGDGLCYSKDRRPSPKMPEAKYNYQNIKITFDGLTAHIENRHLFTDTNEFDAVLSVYKDGNLTEKSSFTVDCPPGESTDFTVKNLPNEKNAEFTLILFFFQRRR